MTSTIPAPTDPAPADDYALASSEARARHLLDRPEAVSIPRLPTPSAAWWAALAMVGVAG